MTDLLLISDIPRLRKVFKRLGEERDIHLRVATSLEKGAEEMSAVKPTVVFVQTHLSGLSAEILLMHLKKQLGRRRSRFVLLSPAEQTSAEAIKQYHGHIDTALDDDALYDSARETISSLTARVKKAAEPQEEGEDAAMAADMPAHDAEPLPAAAVAPAIAPPTMEAAPGVTAEAPRQDSSLEEQGVVYTSRPKLKIQSDFTNSFENAVENLTPAAVDDQPKRSGQVWSDEYQEIIDADLKTKNSPAKSFLLWSVPVLIIVLAVTFMQHTLGTKSADMSKEKRGATADNKPAPTSAPRQDVKQAQGVSPAAPLPPAPVTAAAPAPPTESAASAPQKPAVPVPVPTVAQKPPQPTQSGAASAAAKRLAKLPDFIPSYALDKKYGAANPGWERYKGAVTEFKVFREGGGIKAIQVVDRGGRGVPESFMKGAIRQLTAAPSYAVKSAERKDGYEIQRGQLADNLQAVYYRDADSGKLRAFVVTWQ